MPVREATTSSKHTPPQRPCMRREVFPTWRPPNSPGRRCCSSRGAVGNDKLIGCQHYNDPKIRLLLYNAFAKKKGLFLYSITDELVCSNFPNMPEDYLYDTFWESPYEFPDDELECQHTNEAALVIKVKSADRRIRICRNCAKDVSSLQYVISRLVAEKPLDDFEVTVEGREWKS